MERRNIRPIRNLKATAKAMESKNRSKRKRKKSVTVDAQGVGALGLVANSFLR